MKVKESSLHNAYSNAVSSMRDCFPHLTDDQIEILIDNLTALHLETISAFLPEETK